MTTTNIPYCNILVAVNGLLKLGHFGGFRKFKISVQMSFPVMLNLEMKILVSFLRQNQEIVLLERHAKDALLKCHFQ